MAGGSFVKIDWKTAAGWAVGLALCLGGAAQARPFTAKDLAMLDRVSDPQLSPDGRFLVYGVRSTDWAANRGVGAISILDRKAPSLPPRPLAISDKPATSPRWSPDGRTLYFLSARTGVQQVWRTDTDGSAATQVTNLPINIASFRISPDGKTLVLALNVFPDCETLACTKTRVDARKANQVSAVTFDKLPMFIWDDWQSGERSQLFALKLDAEGAAPGEPVRLLKGFDSEAPDKPFGDDSDYAVTSSQVIFSSLEPGASWGVGTSYKLYAAPLDGSSAPKPLEPGAAGSYGKPTLSPDGSRLAYLGRKNASDDVRAAVLVRDLKTGVVREADPGFDRSADSMKWGPDGKTIYATMGDLGRVRLFAIDAAGGKVQGLTTGGQVSGFSVAADRVVVARDGLGGPAQLYEVRKAGQAQLTRHNAEALKPFDFPAAEQFTFKGWNDEIVHGYVLPPKATSPGASTRWPS